MQNSSRDKNIDLLKGIAMCLVIWGHSIQYSSMGKYDFFALPLFRFIYSFHMPLFIAVSGYLLGASLYKRSFQENVRHRIATIFWPIVTGNLLWVFLVRLPGVFFRVQSGGTSEIFPAVKSILIGKSLTGFWFLWAVLACSIAVCIIFQKVKNPIARIAATIIALFCTTQFPCGNLICNLFPFFLAGAWLGKEKESISPRFTKNAWIGVSAVILFFLLLPFYHEKCFIYSQVYIADMSPVQNICVYAIRLGCGFLGIISVVFLVRFVARLASIVNLRIVHSVLRYLKDRIVFIGENSLKFYIFQSLFFDGSWFARSLRLIGISPQSSAVYESIYVYQFVFTPLFALASAVLLYAIIATLEKFDKAQYLWRP